MNTLSIQIRLVDEAATQALGTWMAPLLMQHPFKIGLSGDLGSGKTTLARAILRALAIEGTIRSPTYTLLEIYPATPHQAQRILHADFYRFQDPDEFHDLGLDDESNALWLIEWPEKAATLCPQLDLCISLSPIISATGTTERQAKFVAYSAIAQALIAALDPKQFTIDQTDE